MVPHELCYCGIDGGYWPCIGVGNRSAESIGMGTTSKPAGKGRGLPVPWSGLHFVRSELVKKGTLASYESLTGELFDEALELQA